MELKNEPGSPQIYMLENFNGTLHYDSFVYGEDLKLFSQKFTFNAFSHVIKIYYLSQLQILTKYCVKLARSTVS